jgi:hypothetical protein
MSRRSQNIWVAIAVLLTLAHWWINRRTPFAAPFEEHAWASAHMALLARSFVQLGVVHLRGVPIQNNLPVGLQPDQYVHWPPLYPILLSGVYRLFGESEAVIHGFVALINFCYLVPFYLLIRRCFDRSVAMFSVFALLTMPAFIEYGTLVWTPNAVLAAIATALYCFVMGTEGELNWKWISAGAAVLAVGVTLSWEAAPLGIILLLLGMVLRCKKYKVAAAVYTASGLGGVGFVLGLLLASSPEVRKQLWATVRFRMGGAYRVVEIPIHGWADHSTYIQQAGPGHLIKALVDVDGGLLGGVLGLLVTTCLVAWSWSNRKERPTAFLTVGSLLGIPLIWVLLFPNHVSVHDYQSLIGVPLVSLGLGFVLNALTEQIAGPFPRFAAIAFPLILLFPLVRSDGGAKARKSMPAPMLDYAREIEDHTPASGIVFSPVESMVPVYYSHRHFIRAVNDDGAFRYLIPKARVVFPADDVYLAVPPANVDQFSCAASHFPVVVQTPNLVLYKVVSDACG